MTSLDALMHALDSDDPRLRQRAALGLGAVDTTPVMDRLVTAMASEPDDFVRETLIWAVVARPTAATGQLLTALRRDDLPSEPLLHALSKIKDPATQEAILDFAGDADATVAAKAWWALGRLGEPAGLRAVLTHLGASGFERRTGVSRALLQFGAPAIDALAQALAHDDAAVRSHAAEVLVMFADPTRYGTLERRTGGDLAAAAADVLRASRAPEVDGALLLAAADDDHRGVGATAQRLRDERG